MFSDSIWELCNSTNGYITFQPVGFIVLRGFIMILINSYGWCYSTDYAWDLLW